MNQISMITVTKNRAKLLEARALTSLQQQTSSNFEWIVINDGSDTATRELVERVKPSLNFDLTYLEMPHPDVGFALCHGRNLGIELAKNDLVAYLDDDNALYPNFVADMIGFMSVNLEIRLALPLQSRSRQVWQNGNVVVRGTTFISPSSDSNVDDLICHRELVDSNGFTHILADAPRWNVGHRIYCDYEYFLQCISLWDSDRFGLIREPLVEYIQSNQGIIGQSNYGDWAKELTQIIENVENYRIFVNNSKYLKCLDLQRDKYQHKSQNQVNIPAFVNK